MRRLSWAFCDGYVALLFEPTVLNPRFTGSSDIGGADADLIVRPCLVEIKTRKEPKLDPYDVYELFGYVFLDYDDAFGIGEATSAGETKRLVCTAMVGPRPFERPLAPLSSVAMGGRANRRRACASRPRPAVTDRPPCAS